MQWTAYNVIPISFLFNCAVMSFVDLVRYIFTIPGVKSFLSRRICQDPIEKFFSCQRQRGGTHDNPSVAEFVHNTQKLRVINSFCRGSVLGNCRGDNTPANFDKENRPIAKRRKCH